MTYQREANGDSRATFIFSNGFQNRSKTNKDIFTERQTSFKNIACLMLDFRRDILGGFLDTSSQELRVLNATKSDRQKCSILNLHVNRLLCK